MILPELRKKNFAIYGLGITGLSVLRFLKKEGIKDINLWDDSAAKRNKLNINNKINNFAKSLKYSDYIIVSPGIDINSSKIKRILLKNKKKIITDLDLFYLKNPDATSIVVTGTNGKSTTSKIIEYVLKKNKKKVNLGGNIGKPVLNFINLKNSIFIIEASSFQLAYSKFVKPSYALILNVSKDHQDWHKSMSNYTNAKMKIFSLQKSNNYAFLKETKLIRLFKKKKFKGKLRVIKIGSYNKIKNKIKNTYLKSKVNEENMSFVYELSKILKINKELFIKNLKNFKGLPHRHEIFYKYKNIKFINDSKATSFQASKHSLESNKNIFWIVGGKPKQGDVFNIKNFKKNIIKTFIIGKNINFFKNQLKNKISFVVTKNLKKTMHLIFKEIKKKKLENINILFSPASASFDQYKNFEERGNEFKQLTKIYAQKFLKK